MKVQVKTLFGLPTQKLRRVGVEFLSILKPGDKITEKY